MNHWKLKLLISLIFFTNSVAAGDPTKIHKDDGIITNILTTIHIVTSYEEIAEVYEQVMGFPVTPGITLEGLSDCWRNVEKNIAYCDIWMFEPKDVDDDATLTLGHEVEHGMYGDRYHR